MFSVLTQTLGYEGRAGERGFRQDDEELLTAVASHPVDVDPKQLSEACGETLQNGIAGLVAIRVIDPLEVVDVSHDDGQCPAVAVGPDNLVGEVRIEVAPVEDTGQGVADRKEANFLVGLAERMLEFEDPPTGTETGHQLGLIEWLREIVIGPSLEPADEVVLGIERGEQHGVDVAGELGPANCLAQLRPVHLGHHPVGDDDGVVVPVEKFQRLTAILYCRDLVPGLGQAPLQDLAGNRIVFRDEDGVTVVLLSWHRKPSKRPESGTGA